ncbi:PAS domain S-box protein [Bradyrhizobium sp. Arg816]|uniref:PAS domain S-box protein n=1 Tax=Bradyrhizobium sp. Arg816 TaxID=2998491 RepID=UPI00249DE467|nr:PAS domain S-box protein [Bradyrhizobium sp. Arg816]MDI3565405.1 PAS domain S-box protein [Bradyrhizobium sp. Arg816]
MQAEQAKQSVKQRTTATGRQLKPNLRSMLSTEELRRRRSRPANYAAENQALIALAQELANSPEGILHKLADTALGLCNAHSAGLSLLEEGDGKSNFHWRAIAGQWAPHLNGGTPRNFGPCGTVLDQNVAMICSHPEVDFPYWEPIKPVLEEGLLIPFYIKAEAVGTIWVVAHDISRRFDAEDLRVMTSLGAFAATAYQTWLNLSAAQRVASIVESSHDAIVSKDLDGTIRSWNGGAQRIFGYLAEEVIGKPITILIPPDRHNEETAILERLRRGERIDSYETVRRRKDGSPVDISLTVSPLRDTEGRVIGASKIARNITERLYAERALRESESRLQAAVDLVGLGCYAWNPQSNKLQWDDTVRAMWGLPAGAVVDYEVWRSCVHPDDLARVEAAIQQSADPRSDGVYNIEYRVIGKTDGVERWIATRGQTNFENDVPASFFGVALEITDRKRIESRLERRVEERTRELQESNQQLRAQIEQREIAEAESQQLQRLEAIGQITSGVAHDFNNLLSVVLTNARMLSRNLRDDPGDQEGMELVVGAAERGVNLTSQLLAFSRQQRLEPQVVDLNSTIVKMGGLLNASLRGAIQLRTNLAADLCPAFVDLTQIQSVILNLVINARDAMWSGGTLTLETFNAITDKELSGPAAPAPGKYVGLTVRDTGMGIPDDVLPRVFEPFFTTKGPGKGSGLGLAQVFGFAKQSGGGIALKTHVGEGTSVTVFLPCAEVVPRVRERESGAEQISTVELKPRILVVDDDRAVLRSTVRVLEALGYAAVPAASGQEALELIANGLKIELVLADFAMPEMTGVELAKAICATDPNLPVILVTGYGDRETLEEFREAQVLRKPYDEDGLMKAILTALT